MRFLDKEKWKGFRMGSLSFVACLFLKQKKGRSLENFKLKKE